MYKLEQRAKIIIEEYEGTLWASMIRNIMQGEDYYEKLDTLEELVERAEKTLDEQS